jgi:acyl-CoA reductase-like NAD-dependent aldehyde dehydrogenase/nicotinamidase-related amidase
MNALLVLVDLQADFLAASGLEPPAGELVEQTARLADGWRRSGAAVAHVWTTVTRAADRRMPHWRDAGLWRCEQGTPGHAPPSALEPRAGEAVFHKAGFSAFAAPEFLAHLRERTVEVLVLAGVHTHACLRQTALDAHQAGLRVLLVEDAVASDDPLHAAITRRYLEARGMPFVRTSELEAALAGERPVTSSARGDEIDRAVRAAGEAAPRIARLPANERAALLRRLADELAGRVGELAEAMVREIGKPVRFGRVEVERTAEMLRAVAERGLEPPDPAEAGPARDARLRRRPHGVCAVVTPWNNPVYIALGKLAPAVVFGNAVLWKPAPQAAGISRAILRCIEAAGWPQGLVSLVEGERRTAARLMDDPRVAAVTITGSCAAGHAAQEICARRRIPLQAELGGNNAAIVWQDADVSDAARKIAAGAFDQAGQRCTANRRVVVHAALGDAFLRALVREAAALPWGDPGHPETRIGPLVDAAQRERVGAAVERARGAWGPLRLPQGEKPPAGSPSDADWHPPVILCCDDPDHEIVQQESFGPVLVVQSAHDWDQAMALCNGVAQGLAAAVFTRDRTLIDRFLDEAQAGILKVGESTADASVDVPFGGWKASGLGPPEHGRFDLDFFTRAQTVYGDPGARI